MAVEPEDHGPGRERDPFEDFTGERASAAHLRASLTRIAEHHAGTPVAAIADDVLAGRRPIRDLADDAEFSHVIADGVDAYRRYLDSMTPAERAAMVEAAQGAGCSTRWASESP